MDSELVKEVMVDLGERLSELGYDAVLETVEGSSVVGRVCQNCRHDRDKKVIVHYMKDIAKTLVKEKPSPRQERAKQVLEEAWQNLKLVLQEQREEDDDDERLARRQLSAPRAALARR